MKEYTITHSDSGQRSDKYLMRILPAASKGFIYKMIRKKNIILNDKRMTGNEILSENDIIKLWLSDETIDKFSQKITDNTEDYVSAYEKIGGSVELIYEDEDFAILNKPAGLLSQRSDPSDLSLNDWFIGYLIKSHPNTDIMKNCKPSIVNRLDRNTSGLVLAAKTVYGLNTLSQMVRVRDITKLYLTYVIGNMTGSGILEGYLHKNEELNKVNIIDVSTYNSLNEEQKADYSYIKTGYNVLNHFLLGDIDITQVMVDLITGRSHQIRAHMASVGYPLLGDDKYGNSNINKRFGLTHQLLHAYEMNFPENNALGKLSGRNITCLHGNPEVFEALSSKNW